MKLELKHLAPYLPYRLKVSPIHTLHGHTGIGSIEHIVKAVNEGKSQFKPILRPLSDLTEEEKKEMHSQHPNLPNYQYFYEEWIDEKGLDLSETIIEYAAMQFLLKHHFDVFGLIEQGLAIDINTLNI